MPKDEKRPLCSHDHLIIRIKCHERTLDIGKMQNFNIFEILRSNRRRLHDEAAVLACAKLVGAVKFFEDALELGGDVG